MENVDILAWDINVRELIADQIVAVVYVGSSKNLACLFTKELDRFSRVDI